MRGDNAGELDTRIDQDWKMTSEKTRHRIFH